MKTAKTEITAPSDFTVFMNWARDRNLNSPLPKQLKDSKAICIPFLLSFFLQNSKYFIFINNIYNNYDALKLSNIDVMKTFKEMIYFTNYSSFSKKKVQPKDNPLVKLLKDKFPYYKKEEIIMAVNIIDNSEDKDTIYEMFGINNVAKVKKLTKAEAKKVKNKISQTVLSTSNILDVL